MKPSYHNEVEQLGNFLFIYLFIYLLWGLKADKNEFKPELKGCQKC